MIFTAVALSLALAAPSPCPAGTTVVMTCPVKKKQIAVCIDAAASPKFAEYRFGALDVVATRPELLVPADRAAGFRPFTFARRTLASGTATSLTFQNGDVGYEVYTQDGKDAGGGVLVSKNGAVIATVACTGDFDEHWEKLEPHLGATTPASTTAKPDPTAGKSQKDICNDDVLLLTKYAWDDLRADGFRKHCCVKGALGVNDDRCELDWPSSDMPECGFFDELRNGIFARYGYTFKDPQWQKAFADKPWYTPRADFDQAWLSSTVQANVASLKVFACPKPATGASCDKGAVNWSLLLQKGAKGQMDGVQQSEIAEALVGQCKSGWSDDVATCFAAGKKGCEDRLTGQQLTDAYDAIRAISPDALK
jgi:hypothetical protein